VNLGISHFPHDELYSAEKLAVFPCEQRTKKSRELTARKAPNQNIDEPSSYQNRLMRTSYNWVWGDEAVVALRFSAPKL
jgi:hypothetical protein